ncbi:MAG: HypC/HybG/HupF family hydrogenase formation chaperone [Hyphomonadaceae bacterium]|nr:HypC/HybG/HupF family hydrogenase formation chaperone [Clostridia bacterium]
MCVAVPGKVIEINQRQGKVSFGSTIIDIDLGLVNVNVGDFVLVHAGCAIEVMQKEHAEEILALYAELEEVLND